MANDKRFIPFNYTKENSSKESTAQAVEKNLLLDTAISISVHSGELLCHTHRNNGHIIRRIALDLKEQLEIILSQFPEPEQPKPTNYIAFTGATLSNSIAYGLPDYKIDFKIQESDLLKKSREIAALKLDDRHLDNGGMAPIKEWKSITEVNLKSSDKYNLIEEMRKMQSQGATIGKSTFHYKTPISIVEFTEPFKYLENMHDYSGPFLITLLKSDIEIANQAATLQVDLSTEKDSCANGENIILSVYDITGSPSNNEEKKFLIVLLFDKLNGILRYSHTIFMNGKKGTLSSRQINEVEKFCKTKKINTY